MNVINCEQGTSAWKAARAGHVTASRVADVMAKIKTGEAASRRDYRTELVAEILTGEPVQDDFSNEAIKWGTAQEPFARAAYELRKDVMVDQVGFVLHPSLERAGASPDGLVGEDGLLEIKCPKTATHIEYFMDGSAPAKYKKQMLWQMACTGREWCDFVSFDPRLPEYCQLMIARFYRNSALIAEMEREVELFNQEVDAVVSTLRGAQVNG